jgi:glycosyltransferase involved in cell wall biosynthesis
MTSAEQLRVLIVTPSVPYPPSWGFGIRVYQMIRHLALRHRVTVLAYAGPDDHDRVGALRQTGATVRAVIRDEPTTVAKRRAQLTSMLMPVSFQRHSLSSRVMQTEIDRLLASEQFDVIQVESSQMSCFAYRSGATLLVDEHNIEYELLYRTFKTERSPIRKLYNWIEYQKFRREEQRSWIQADGCILTSDRERVILNQHAPHTPTTVVPNGVDVEYFQASPVQPDLNSIVFVGVMHYRPNVDAAVHFIRDILPHVVRDRSSATFTIVGGGAPEELQRLAGPNVMFTDTVPDTRPYVSRAGAFVVPLRMGSGTRLKVLEGLAMSRPLISTSLGCEGIDAVDGQHLMIADDPRAFAQSVLRVLDDRELAARLGRSGRELAERSYSWSSVLQRLEQFMFDRRAHTRSMSRRAGERAIPIG